MLERDVLDDRWSIPTSDVKVINVKMSDAMSLVLTSRQRTQLKARAHHLKPVVRVGLAGLSAAFIAEVDRALTDHELIKIRIDSDVRDERDAMADEICARTASAPVQRLGKTLTIWRPKPDEDA